jgi:hypothetical protein
VGDAASAPAAAQPALGATASPPADLETAFGTDLQQFLADWQQRNGMLGQPTEYSYQVAIRWQLESEHAAWPVAAHASRSSSAP